MFKQNVGTVDSNIRLLVGVVLIVMALLITGIMQYVLALAGFVLVFTGIFRFCPAYMVMGKNTCEMDKK